MDNSSAKLIQTKTALQCQINVVITRLVFFFAVSFYSRLHVQVVNVVNRIHSDFQKSGKYSLKKNVFGMRDFPDNPAPLCSDQAARKSAPPLRNRPALWSRSKRSSTQYDVAKLFKVFHLMFPLIGPGRIRAHNVKPNEVCSQVPFADRPTWNSVSLHTHDVTFEPFEPNSSWE